MYLKIHPRDNVFVAIQNLEAGNLIKSEEISFSLKDNISAKHKFTDRDLKEGDLIYMYGIVAGRAHKPINQGCSVTTQNITHAVETYNTNHDYTNQSWQSPDISRWKNKQFMGYHRDDGRVGTANYWVFIPLVFCENRNLQIIEEILSRELGYSQEKIYHKLTRELVTNYQNGGNIHEVTVSPEPENAYNHRLFENIDGVKFLQHNGGCGGTREDAEVLCQLLAGYICHPNVAGATILSLGCQHAETDILLDKIKHINPGHNRPLLFFEQQQEASEKDLISRAIKDTFTHLVEANKLERKPAPLSKLVLGLECGGSDGFSGISANPAMGHTSDLLVALGGSVILSEFPELCGVEQELINRCTDQTTANRFISIQQAYARRAEAVGSGFDMNPSPGNIKDGLITDAIKSAGAAKKGGTSPVTGVLDYTEQVHKPGLNLLCTPGNDVESTTGLAGSGANMILFSTGMGTPTGNPVTPVVKISSNSDLARRLPDLIDFNAGTIIDGSKTVNEVGEEILDYCIALASGEQSTRAMDLQQNDFIPWKRGVSL